MKVLILIFSLFTGLSLAGDFETANKLYLEGNFSEAINAYHKLIVQSPKGEYFSNLGSAYFREGQIPEALFYFRKAHEKLPRDEDIKYGLDYIRSLKKEALKTEESFLSRLRLPMQLEESFLFLFILGCVVAALWGSKLSKKSKIYLNIRNIAALCFFLLFLNHIALDLRQKPYIVVKADSTKVYSGPGSANVVLFEIGKGAEGDILETLDNKWVQIKFSENKKGWIFRDNLVM